jgi:short-subunit dehydrogenase
MFKRALITGATSGIGESLALHLASKGISLILTGRNAEALNRIKEECARKVSVETFVADLTESQGREKAIQSIEEYTPDLVINNAGLGIYGPAISHSIEAHRKLIDVDILALTEITLAAAKHLQDNQMKGTIMNVASAAAFQPFPYFSTYAAAKAYVVSFSKSMDYELSETGIRVLVSCPGQVQTAFSERASGKPVQVAPRTIVMTAEFAAEEIFHQIVKGKQLHTFDWKYRLMTALSPLIPESIRAKLLRRIVSRRARLK